MVERLANLRRPVAWVVIAVTFLSMLLAIVRAILGYATGTSSLAQAAQDLALHSMSLPLVMAVVALVIVSVFHAPIEGAARLVTAAVAVVTTGTVLTIVGALLGLSASAGPWAVVLEALGVLLDVVLKVAATVSLWLVQRGMAAGRIEVPATPVVVESRSAEIEPSRPAPTWTADAASGSVWTSASDAAKGERPSAHGVPGEGAGWRPVARPKDLSTDFHDPA